MCTADERVIERLGEVDWSTPRLMAQHLRFHASERRLRERCQMLAEAGLIVPVVEGSEMYEITSEGIQYLRGDLDAEHQPRPWPPGLKG